MKFEFQSIGTIHTPYLAKAPYQPIEDDAGDFYVVVDSAYTDGLKSLEKFRYIILIYGLHRQQDFTSSSVSPPWTHHVEIGVFASRSPVRPNPIGLSIVKILGIRDNRIQISGVDAFDGTPLLDIKPYIDELDAKKDANLGWLSELDSDEHLLLHIKGIPHDH